MNFTFTTDYSEKPLWNDNERTQAVDKMFAIANNLEYIISVTNKTIQEDRQRGVKGSEYWKDISLYEVGDIRCFEDVAIDEFSFYDDEGMSLTNFSFEVVTEAVAISNDKEWLSDLNYTDEDRQSYVLGECMSDYIKLPNLSPKGVQYYFKLM